MRIRGLIVVGAAVCAACTPSTGSESRPIVADSAGVVIVTSSEARLSSTFQPRSRAPLGVYGVGEADALFERVAGARLLSDGRVIVLDQGARSIREYAPDGSLAGTWAGPGEGPGELVFPSNLIRLPGDSIEVWDRRLARLYTFDESGTLVRSLNVRADGTIPDPQVERVGPGIWGSLSINPQGAETLVTSPAGRLTRVPLAVLRLTVDGVQDTLAHLAGFRQIEDETSRRFAALGSQSPWAGSGGGLVVGSGDFPQYEVLDSTGAVRTLVRWTQSQPPVAMDAVLEVANRIGPLPADHPMIQPEFLPEVYPAFEWLLWLGERVWVGSASPFLSNADPWRVFTSGGEWLATVELGRGAHVMDHLGSRLLVRETDELGVQTLAVYELQFSRGSA